MNKEPIVIVVGIDSVGIGLAAALSMAVEAMHHEIVAPLAFREPDVLLIKNYTDEIPILTLPERKFPIPKLTYTKPVGKAKRVQTKSNFNRRKR